MTENEDGKREVVVHVNTFIAMGLVALMILGAAVFVTIAANRETQALGKCLVEQMTEHRNDNRNSHETLSQHHLDVIGDETGARLPEPPRTMPRPKNREQLLASCEGYLKNVPDYETREKN